MDRILLLLDNKENRRMLEEWLMQRYKIILPNAVSLPDEPFDLAIMDGQALDRLWEKVQLRKEAEGQLFLPVLLVTPRQDVKLATRHLWRTVDELILAPIEKLELEARMKILLRARRQSIALARSSEARFQAIFEGVPVAIWEADLTALKTAIVSLQEQGVSDVAAYLREHPKLGLQALHQDILRANVETLKMFGAQSKEELLASLNEIFLPESRAALCEAQVAVAEGKQYFETETVFRTLQGDPLYVLLRVAISSKDEPFGHALVSMVDITPLKKAQEDWKKLQEQFQQAQKLESIGRLAASVAHDFNNMLSVINGYAELLLKKLPPNDPLRTSVMRILEAGQRSSDLTRQLLAFSRKQTLQPRVLDLNNLLRNLEKMLSRLIGEHIDLKLILAQNLSYVMADPAQMEQVIMNLVVNARDAMPEGGKLTIETADVILDENYARTHVGIEEGKYVMLTVTDTGHGMDKETLNRIFEPFFTTKQQGKGTGLGLSTVYGIVKQSGGHIWVYSELGRGTSFKILLPAMEAKRELERPVTEKEPEKGLGEHILVVEDEEALRRMIESILTTLGYSVTLASNGAEALLMVEEKGLKPDLLITDVVMPIMGGKELVERLQKKYPDLKVLYMSGYTGDVMVHEGIYSSDTAFIQKPFAMKDLAEKVREVLGKK